MITKSFYSIYLYNNIRIISCELAAAGAGAGAHL
jgi:hypothetical protein